MNIIILFLGKEEAPGQHATQSHAPGRTKSLSFILHVFRSLCVVEFQGPQMGGIFGILNGQPTKVHGHASNLMQ